MSYRDDQREKAVELRDGMFHDAGGGIIGTPRTFALQNPRLNLWSGIADDALLYFETNAIPWWKAAGEESDSGLPSSHLLSSQVTCVNHLYSIRQREDIALAILKNIDPRICRAQKVETGFVEFEIIGAKNYLGEHSHTKGVLSTSIDAVMIGQKKNKNILVLIEWKYTEEYITGDNDKNKGKSGEHRHAIYDPLLKEKSCPISVENFEALYYEPFYQLMRQTLLGWKMVEHNEYGCDEFVHIHVIPDKNEELLNNVTSPLLRKYGNTISEAWKGVLKKPDKYQVISPERLFEPLKDLPDTKSLLEYLSARYWK